MKRIDTPLYSVAQIRTAEQALFQTEDSYAVMIRAAQGLCDVITADYSASARTVHIILGAGNNAGDGLVAAALLKKYGFRVCAYTVFSHEFSGDAAKAADLARAENVDIQPFTPFACKSDDIIIEAVFGIGLDRPAAGNAKVAIEHINICKAQHCGLAVYAVDVPAGINANTGASLGIAVQADKTVTFIDDKIGLHTANGKGCAGEVIVCALEAHIITQPVITRNEERVTQQPSPTLQMFFSTEETRSTVAGDCRASPSLSMTGSIFRYHYEIPQLAARHNTHKGDYGHALIIGGGQGMFGAAALASVSALKVGTGKASVYSHPDYAAQFHLNHTPLYEVMLTDNLQRLSPYSAVVLGVGLGRDHWGKVTFEQTLYTAKQPLLIDADGLWHLAAHKKHENISIITPHEAEAARLLNLSIEAIRQDKPSAVLMLAQQFQCVVVLKGAGTLISDGQKIWINESGNACLATAGTGDVLAGMIGGYLAQGLSALDAALYGVYRHGLAADHYLLQHGDKTLRASDLWAML